MIEQTFSQGVLAQLREEGYRPAAWGTMLANSWRQSRETARAHPNLVHEWLVLAAGLSATTAISLAHTIRRDGWHVARRTALPLALATLIQLGDIYVHLGLHRAANRQIHRSLGPAIALTAMRGWAGSWITSRLIARSPLADDELLLSLAAIVGTDLIDGPLARRHDLASPLGRYLDGEADIISWAALTLTQVHQRQLPSWFLFIYGMRWFMPMALGFGRTFATAEPVVLLPSRLSRFSGAGQVALAFMGIMGSLRAEHPDVSHWRRLRGGLLMGTSALLIGATARLVARLSRR